MKKIFSLPIMKRKLICLAMWLSFWFLCAYFTWVSSDMLLDDIGYWWSPIMWSVLYNRFMVWMFVFIGWVITIHPVFKNKIMPWFRGFLIWSFVSIELAIGTFMWWDLSNWNSFWMVVIVWWFIWLVIDVVSTKYAGEGKDMLRTL